MTRTFAGLTAIWAAVTLVSSAPAQQNLERRTTIDVIGASPRDVYESLSRVLGYGLAIAPGVEQPVTMHLENVTVRTALNALSENLGCRWNIDGNTLHVEPAGKESPEPAGVAGGVSHGVPGGVPRGVIGGVPGGIAGGAPAGGVSHGVPGGVIGEVPGGIAGGVPAGGADLRQRLARRTPANFSFLDRPLRTIIEAVGKVAGLEVEVEDPFQTQHVTVDLSNRTVLSALRAIQSESGTIFLVTFSGPDQKMHVRVNLPRPNDGR